MIENNRENFVKECNLTIEERIQRGKEIKENIKSNPNYIGDLIKENPYLYNSWRGIRFSKKGKKVGTSEEWKSFRVFYNDVFPTYRKGYRLRRLDLTKPFSKDNFIWLSDEEVGLIRTTVLIEYNNERLSLQEWATKANVSYTALRNRYDKHKDDWPIKDIIFGKPIKRKDKECKDYRDSNQSIRSKASKMISSYKFIDKKKTPDSICDFDIDWLINNIFKSKCVYCGDNKRLGADRIDNDKGHTKDNVVPCCHECNIAKNRNFTFDEMKIIGEAIRKVKKERLIK